jgi:hypothetical protein
MYKKCPLTSMGVLAPCEMKEINDKTIINMQVPARRRGEAVQCSERTEESLSSL